MAKKRQKRTRPLRTEPDQGEADLQFAREVDDELRREALKRFWKAVGPYVIGACVVIVGTVAGWRGWTYWQDERAKEAGGHYVSALRAEGALGSPGVDRSGLEALRDGDHAGYSVLARFRLAGERARSGDKTGAVAAFDALASDETLADRERALASLRAAYVLVDGGDVEAIRARVGGLAANEGAFRHGAREALGLAHLSADDKVGANQWFRAAMEDPALPGDMRARVAVYLQILESDGIGAKDRSVTP